MIDNYNLRISVLFCVSFVRYLSVVCSLYIILNRFYIVINRTYIYTHFVSKDYIKTFMLVKLNNIYNYFGILYLFLLRKEAL